MSNAFNPAARINCCAFAIRWMCSEPLMGGGNEVPGVDALSGGGGVTPDVCAASDDGLNASMPAVAAIPRKARLPVNIVRPSLWSDLLFPIARTSVPAPARRDGASYVSE